MIIPALHERQKNRGGYLTQSDMKQVAEELAVPLHRVHSLVTFFPHFRTTPPKEVEVHVCRDMACHLRGSVAIEQELHDWAKNRFGDKVECAVFHVSAVAIEPQPPSSMRIDTLDRMTTI